MLRNSYFLNYTTVKSGRFFGNCLSLMLAYLSKTAAPCNLHHSFCDSHLKQLTICFYWLFGIKLSYKYFQQYVSFSIFLLYTTKFQTGNDLDLKVGYKGRKICNPVLKDSSDCLLLDKTKISLLAQKSRGRPLSDLSHSTICLELILCQNLDQSF